MKYAEGMNESTRAGRKPFPVVVIIAALVLFGLVTLTQWLISSLAGILKFAVFVVIIVAVGSWVVGLKGKR